MAGGTRRPVHTTDVVERPSDLTVEWLTSAIGTPIAGFTYERIGTGQMSECFRVELSHAAEGGRAAVGGPEGRCDRSDEQADRPGAGTVRA